MEEIGRAARAYYENLSDEEKQNARSSFDEMDKDRDGKINRDEYVEYLKKDNNPVLPSLFTALDKDGNGSLDFNETIVLYYLNQSGRAIICKGCDSFLAGAYFSCSECFFNNDDSVSTFDVCCDCYGDKKFIHNNEHIFCNNNTLLSRSRILIQADHPDTIFDKLTKRTQLLGHLKKGMQAAGMTSGDIGGMITGEDGVDSSKSSCSIM